MYAYVLMLIRFFHKTAKDIYTEANLYNFSIDLFLNTVILLSFTSTSLLLQLINQNLHRIPLQLLRLQRELIKLHCIYFENAQ